MPITASISIVVPALPDNDIWFANSAAWSNYWDDIEGDVSIDPIETTVYVPSPYNAALAPHQITIDSDIFVVPTMAMWASLLAELAAVNASYQLLRTELRTAGLITNAQ